jgi:MFS family permease
VRGEDESHAAALIVTVYGITYCMGSYGAGVLSDRLSRKRLLSIGILGNAAVILLMGLTRQYELLLALGVAGGLFGTLFHPGANALAPAHYPRASGMAIGLLGMGSGLGFFLGPRYAGWRAQTAHWQLAGLTHVSNWQRPCVELGVAGLIVGVLFWLLATDSPDWRAGGRGPSRPMGRPMRRRVTLLASILAGRDFAGVAMLSLFGIYLQRIEHFSPMNTGAVLGWMMIPSVALNPLAVWLSPGRRRLPALVGVLIAGGCLLPLAPCFGAAGAIILVGLFMTAQMVSYSLSDAAMLERVDGAMRGRVVGLFLMIAGTAGAAGPWIMGAWSDALGPHATARDYLWPFGLCAALIALASFAAPVIHRLGPPRQSEIEPFMEISPATMEPIA